MNSMQNAGLHLPRRGGMQVHAVPEAERALDANGVRLPWGYEYADPDRSNQRRAPEEKGPFGKSTSRRGSSRTKTYTPSGSTKEDKANEMNWKIMDEIFMTPKKENAKSQQQLERSTVISPEPTAGQPSAATAALTQLGEPTEVILYGFSEAFQWAAIEFYERVSMGVIYEDYDRSPPNPRYDMSLTRNVSSRSVRIPLEALAKVNRYHGGNSWIKVTFDSAEAADRACYYSPHKLHGYLVYAERYRGTGPHTEGPIPATEENLSVTNSPSQNSGITSNTKTITLDQSSVTASSATPVAPVEAPKTPAASGREINQTSSALRVRGARRLELLPAEKAILPAASRWHRTFGAWPIIGWFFSGPGDMIGNEIPLKESGEFDWDNATLYWTFWALLDYYLFFANFLGLKD